MSFETIELVREGAIASVNLNRPDRKNAISPRMASELITAFETLHGEPEVRVIVLGANGKVFCAGGDFGQMAAGGDEAPLKGDFADLMLAMVRSEKPIIAKVGGHAMGGGLGLVAASTFAVMSRDAQMGTPEVNVGLFPMMIMAVLARTMPRRVLLEMMLRGQRLDADACARHGLVNRVVEHDRLEYEVAELAADLAARAPVAIARGLRAYAQLGDKTLADALPFLRDELYGLIATDDAREGLMAFMEKRAPHWTGR